MVACSRSQSSFSPLCGSGGSFSAGCARSCIQLKGRLGWKVPDGHTDVVAGGAGFQRGDLSWPLLLHQLDCLPSPVGSKISQEEAARSLETQAWVFTQHHFCHVLQVKASQMACACPKGVGHRLCLWKGKAAKHGRLHLIYHACLFKITTLPPTSRTFYPSSLLIFLPSTYPRLIEYMVCLFRNRSSRRAEGCAAEFPQ